MARFSFGVKKPPAERKAIFAKVSKKTGMMTESHPGLKQMTTPGVHGTNYAYAEHPTSHGGLKYK